MIAAGPNDPNVIWLKTGLAIASVHLADDKAVEAALQDIVAKHGSDDRVVEALGQIAWAYRKLQKYDKALTINQYTVDHWSQKERAAYAQQGIVLSQIGLRDFAAADQAFDVLIQKFSKDPDASKIILWSGFGYQDANQAERAYKVYELVVQNYPDTPEAVTAQLRLAVASVQAGDRSGMDQTIQTLLKQFAPTQDKAAQLFNQVAATWPDKDHALFSRIGLATIQSRSGNEKDAEAIYRKVLADYRNHPALPEGVLLAGEDYYERAMGLAITASGEPGKDVSRNLPDAAKIQLRQAIAKWNDLTTGQSPSDSSSAAKAQYYTVLAYSVLAERQSLVGQGAKLLQQ